ncbi:MAG: iron-containing alcohol dehydrogenase [Oscillospiraceae bacterium]|jgi:alcohol dehydrogenase|nr:iron-containing alcohol dehydrogenase [Oscillospiraceae bacterium]
MNWQWHNPVRVIFGTGAAAGLGDVLTQNGWERPALVASRSALGSGVLRTGDFVGVFSDVRPNPTHGNVRDCAAFLRTVQADVVVALGGGSVLDCAKIAAHTDSLALPLVALPTTAGTGSEVTMISVLSDDHTGAKAPVAAPKMYPHTALVDPRLTLSVPPRVTADTGMDALSHALEALWSRNHNPASDALAKQAARLILRSIENAYADGADLSAREALSEGALLAGLAFAQTKTAGVHACSFPLTADYGLTHGAACAFTLAAFTRLNGEALTAHTHALGFATPDALADEIDRLNAALGIPRTLADAGIPAAALPTLAAKCLHPNMQNNPVILDAKGVQQVLETLA